MKVIFLDIDGVLNWSGSQVRLPGSRKVLGIDPSRVERLNRIIDQVPDVKIVVSSTWRYVKHKGLYEDFAGLKKYLNETMGVKAEIVGHTPFPRGFHSAPRGEEIRKYLKSCPAGEVESFVILDDDTSCMFPFWDENDIDLRPFHVVTEFYTPFRKSDEQVGQDGGLQESDIAKAVSVLNGAKLDVAGYPETFP